MADEGFWEVRGIQEDTVPENLLSNLAGLRSQTTSLVLPNGKILHQWSARCPVVTDGTPPGA
jgi:hypothetical protein